MRFIFCTVLAALVLVFVPIARGQGKARRLVAVWAHADDEGPVAPILARYAREGVQVHMIIATDGAQGAANTSVPRGPEIAELRVEEARCSAQALPPFVIPRAELFTVRVPFTDADLNAGRRSFECHKTQVSQEAIDRVIPAMRDAWKGEIPLSPMVPEGPAKDLFR